jgi:hypothetical protein
MSNKNLFKEAIADAKAVREAALANAKAALEEALTPKLQSMLAAKLNEMEMEEDLDEYAEMQPDRDMDGDGDIDADDVAKMGEGFDTEEFGFDRKNGDVNENEYSNDLEEDFDLSEILAELGDDENLYEAKKEKEEEDKKKKKKMMKEAEEEEEEEEEETEEESEDVADMSVEDLKALIKDIVAQEMGNEEGGEEAGEEMSMDMGGEKTEEESDEINLDELLAELDALGEGDDDMEEESMYEAKKMKAKKAKEEEEKKKEMKEAIATINTLRSELNEVNLLNAKLLYVNKIFKAKNLSESQKLQVIASFDKATTAKEAKVVFESLNNTLTAAPKQAIKESYGFASRAAGVAPKKAIVESNDVITRMQKLANIIK